MGLVLGDQLSIDARQKSVASVSCLMELCVCLDHHGTLNVEEEKVNGDDDVVVVAVLGEVHGIDEQQEDDGDDEGEEDKLIFWSVMNKMRGTLRERERESDEGKR